MRISIETPFIDADRFSFTLCLSSGSRFSGMLRFSDVDSGKWNSPAKFRTTGINRSRLNPIFFPSANFCLPKSKIKKEERKKESWKIWKFNKKIIAEKVDACEPERERDRPEWPRTKSGEKQLGAGVAAPVVGKEVGWFIDLSRGLYQDGIPRRRSKPFPSLCCLFLGSFLRPSSPESIWFWNIQCSGGILLSFQSFLADAEDEEFAKVGRGQRGMPRRVFGTKVVFPRHGPRLAGIEVSNEFPLKFNSRSVKAAWKRIDRRVIRGYAFEGKLVGGAGPMQNWNFAHDFRARWGERVKCW